ncbi:MAG: glycosyltransferase family 4 protein [Candidatus Poribacteria bacterium]|nr:glycosyltransferase family 4 protein [Candidatus Poribacteria bacterium]
MNERARIGIGWQLMVVSGWGVYGTNLALQLRRTGRYEPVPLMEPTLAGLLNPLHAHLLKTPLLAYQSFRQLLDRAGDRTLTCPFPVLHAMGNQLSTTSVSNQVRGSRNVGVVFFENTDIPTANLAAASRYDAIVAGSTWNAELLRQRGLKNVRTAFQGIEPTLFHPAPRSNLFSDRFVVFSGGKLEHRKGQDIVIAAFREFHKRHPDALLLTAWYHYNHHTMVGFETAGHVEGLPENSIERGILIGEWLERNGLPPDSFFDVGAISNYAVPQVVREADVALFTNRCEGGTNLVAMECLACGIPTILSANTGHLDLIRDDNCYALTGQGRVVPSNPTDGVDGWGESSVEEVVESLERVYVDREDARRCGENAAVFMRDWSWEKQIERLLTELQDLL